MSKKLLAGVAVAAGLAALTQLPKAVPSVQAQSQEAASGPAPTMPWGVPSLEGIWTRDSEEPLQRPSKYKDKEFFTDEERAAIDKQRADIIARDASQDRRTQGGKGSAEQDVGGAYNAEIYTSHLRLGRRTAMIVEPKDGRLPDLAPRAKQEMAALIEYSLELKRSTEVCKNERPACRGGKYNPVPSPRRLEAPPYYITGLNGLPGTGAGIISRSDGPEDRGHGERCMLGALPDFAGYRRIVQSPKLVSILHDTGQGQGWIRTVPITDAPHASSRIKQWWGDPRGKWEGDTLVVDITNFSPKSNFNGAHDGLHLTERWKRLDADTIEYTVRVEDPTTWVAPWIATHTMKKQADEPNRIYPEPRCHEGNYGMAAMLQGARNDEALFKAGKAPNPATKCLGACGGFNGGFADEGDDANPLR
ncbi:MAG: hypothetical protein AB7I13_10495 [Vicinamibacterales bacterium]